MGGVRAAAAGAAVMLVLLTGCGKDDTAAAPPSVQVTVGQQDVTAEPTQYCLDGKRQQYSSVTPPIIEVTADQPIRLTVPDSVAEQGWSVQVFDDHLEQKIGDVEVEAGARTFDQITGSDVVPPAFYLVVVENKGTACGEFSGAWPIGFIRPQ